MLASHHHHQSLLCSNFCMASPSPSSWSSSCYDIATCASKRWWSVGLPTCVCMCDEDASSCANPHRVKGMKQKEHSFQWGKRERERKVADEHPHHLSAQTSQWEREDVWKKEGRMLMSEGWGMKHVTLHWLAHPSHSLILSIVHPLPPSISSTIITSPCFPFPLVIKSSLTWPLN